MVSNIALDTIVWYGNVVILLGILALIGLLVTGVFGKSTGQGAGVLWGVVMVGMIAAFALYGPTLRHIWVGTMQ